MELDKSIASFEYYQGKKEKECFILELKGIMESGNYKVASKYILELGKRRLSKQKTEACLRYIYSRLINKKPMLTIKQLRKIR
jgi:hypothetical protein